MEDTELLRRLERLTDLAIEPHVPVGTRVFVEEDGTIYTGVGQTRPEVAAHLGWTQPNVWLPLHAQRKMERDHDVILDHISVASFVLQNSVSVQVGHERDSYYFIVAASQVRELGLLSSRSTRFVDLVVQSRQASDGRKFLRLFHLSPATRNKGGRQLWPS